MNYSYGCHLLINEFTALKERLTTHYSFEISQREHALRLGGHYPNELFTNKVVMEFNRAYFGSLQGPGGFNAAQLANALMYDRPAGISEGEFERRLEQLLLNVPTIEEGHAQLQDYVDRWIAQLTERMELVTFREERALEQAIGLTQADVSAESEKRARYIAQSDRVFNSSLRLMLALKADRYKYDDCDLDDSEPGAEPGQDDERGAEVATEPVETDPQTAVIPADTVEKPSEPDVSQVGAPEAGNDEISTPPAALEPAAAPVGNDPLRAVIETGYKAFDDLREYDQIE